MDLTLSLLIIVATMLGLVGVGGVLGMAMIPGPRATTGTIGAFAGLLASAIVLMVAENYLSPGSESSAPCGPEDFAGRWRAGPETRWIFGPDRAILCEGACDYGFYQAPKAWAFDDDGNLTLTFAAGVLDASAYLLRCRVEASGNALRFTSDYPGFINVILVREKE